MSTTDPDGHDCAWCPARRFPSRQALADHEREHRLAELATIARDPLAVLREAVVWAQDEGALRLIPAEFHPLFDLTRLRQVRSASGFVASLVGKSDGIEVRARLTDGGRELHLQVDIPPRASQRTRVHLPAEFALLVERGPVPRDSRAMAERLAEAAARGVEAEGRE